MKPKERFLNYALFPSTNCETNASLFKEDIPIDLSTKKPTPNGHSYSLFKEYEHPTFHSPPHFTDWAARYCFPNLVAKQYGYPPNIFPYLFINSNCLSGTDLEKRRDDTLYEPFGLPYRLPQESVVLPFKLDPYAAIQQKGRILERPPLSTESSSPSSSSSPYNSHEYPSPNYNDTKRSPPKRSSQASPESSELKNFKGSHHSVPNQTAKLKKSLSFPCLKSAFKRHNKPTRPPSPNILRRTKSECNLHLIKSYSTSSKICAPKKLFASNYYQNKLKENQSENKHGNGNSSSTTNGNNKVTNGSQTRFYRNYRKEVLGEYIVWYVICWSVIHCHFLQSVGTMKTEITGMPTLGRLMEMTCWTYESAQLLISRCTMKSTAANWVMTSWLNMASVQPATWCPNRWPLTSIVNTIIIWCKNRHSHPGRQWQWRRHTPSCCHKKSLTQNIVNRPRATNWTQVNNTSQKGRHRQIS